MRPARHLRGSLPAALAAVLVLAACGTDAPAGSLAPSGTTAASAEPTALPSPPSSTGPGAIEPAPGSDSVAYPPNPAAIVVAIDAGHGGCLDWGVPDPSERGPEFAEKTMTLGIARRLRDRLEADGIGTIMIRDADEALAGDDYPDLGCTGPPWRDVDGDGEAGFEETGRIRTRDELQARIDLANLARADLFVSIHVNSLTQDGVVFDIAATQTFYDDETPWGAERSAELARALQDGVVDALDPLSAHYERQDRGTQAVAYYAISRAWAHGDTCETPGDTWCKPHRALLMPSALAEVGSITLRQEHDLLASAEGQAAVADGLFEGIAAYLGQRGLAVRIGLEGEPAGIAPSPAPGEGPPFVAPYVPNGPLRLRVTNVGVEPWPVGMELRGGWAATDLPYLPEPPAGLDPLGPALPALEPGASMVVDVSLPAPPDGRAVAWIGAYLGEHAMSDAGAPPLQLSSEAD